MQIQSVPTPSKKLMTFFRLKLDFKFETLSISTSPRRKIRQYWYLASIEARKKKKKRQERFYVVLWKIC